MITGSPIIDGTGWVPIPIQTARDPHLDRRAIGLLVELLSYPSGWDNNADRLAAKGREGRDATRAAMAKLEDAGYVIHLRYRAERGRWLTASFAGSTPGVARSLADTWCAEHPDFDAKQKPSSDRRTGFQSSVNQASADQSSENQAFNTYKTDRKSDLKTVEQDQEDAAIAASCVVDAIASTIADADASARAQDDQSGIRRAERQPAQRRRKRQSLAEHLADLDPDTLDDLLIELECSRGSIVDWALPRAQSLLGLDDEADPHDETGGPLAAKTLELALPALYKRNGMPPEADAALAGYEWPYAQDWAVAQQPTAPRERGRTEYLSTAKGREDKDVLDEVYAGTDEIGPEGRAAMAEAFRSARPEIFAECERRALGQFERANAKVTADGLAMLTIKYGQQHYCGKWPKYLIAERLRAETAPRAA